MEQALATINKKLTDFLHVEDAPLTALLILAGNTTNDNNVFIDAHNLTESGGDDLPSSSEQQFVQSIHSQIHSLTKINELTQLTNDIHAYLLENVLPLMTTYSQQVMHDIETIRRKKEQLQMAWTSKSVQSPPPIDSSLEDANENSEQTEFDRQMKRDANIEDQHVSSLATESFSSILLLLLKSVEKHQPSVIDQVLTLALQLYENLPMNYLSTRTKNTQFLFQSLLSLTNYINELFLMGDDRVLKQKTTRILLSLAIAKGSFKDLLPLLHPLIFGMDDVLDVRKLFTQLNNGLSTATKKFEYQQLHTAIDQIDETDSSASDEQHDETQKKSTPDELPSMPVAYLTSAGTFPSTDLPKLEDHQLSGPFIASIILTHVDFHNDLNGSKQFESGSMDDSISFAFDPNTFKLLFSMIEQLTTKQDILPIDLHMLTVLLKLSRTHLRFLCAVKEEVPGAKPDAELDSVSFIISDDLPKWFDLLLKLTLADDAKFAQTTISEEAFKALNYIIQLRFPSFVDKLAFYYTSVIDNRVPMLAKQSFIELNKSVALVNWIELLCDDNPRAFTLLYSLTDTMFAASKDDDVGAIGQILHSIQRLLFVKLMPEGRKNNTTLAEPDSPLPAIFVMSKLITYVITRGLHAGPAGKDFFDSILLDLCSMTNTKELLHFAIVQPIFIHVLPLLSDCAFHRPLEEERRNALCWLLGQIVNILIVGSPEDGLEEKYVDRFKSPLFAGGCEKTIIDRQQSLHNLFDSNLATSRRFDEKETDESSSVDNELLSSIYNHADQGVQLLSKMKPFGKNKHALLQKSVEQQADQACAAVFAVYIKYFYRMNLVKHELTRVNNQKPHPKLLAIFDYASYVYTLFATTKGQGGDCQQLLSQIQTNTLFLLTSIGRSQFIPMIELDAVETPAGSVAKSSRWKKERHSFRLIRNVFKASSRFRKTILANKRSITQSQDNEHRLHQSIAEFIYRTNEHQNVHSDEIVQCLVRQYERAVTRLMTYHFVSTISDKVLLTEDQQLRMAFLSLCLPYFRGTHLEWTYLEHIQTANKALKERIADCYYSIIKTTLSSRSQSTIPTRTVFHLLNFSYEEDDIRRLHANQFVESIFNVYVSSVQGVSSAVSLYMRFLGYSWFRIYLLKLSEHTDTDSEQSDFVFHQLILIELKQSKQRTPKVDSIESKQKSLVNTACDWFLQAASTEESTKPDVELHTNQFLFLLLRCLNSYPHAQAYCATADYAEVVLDIYRHSNNPISILLALKVLRYLIPLLSECTDESFKLTIKTLLDEILLRIDHSSSEITTELIYLYRTIMSVASPWQSIAMQLLLDTISASSKFDSLEQLPSDQVKSLFSAIAILGGYIYPYSLSAVVQVYSEEDITLESQFAVIVDIDQTVLDADSPDARPYVIQHHYSDKIEHVGAHKIRIEVEVPPPMNLDETISTLFDVLVSFIRIETSPNDSLLLLELRRRSVAALYRLLNNNISIDLFLRKPYASILAKLSLSDLFATSNHLPLGLRISNKQHLEQYSLSLDRYERSKAVIDDSPTHPEDSSAFIHWNDQPMHEDHRTGELLSAVLSTDDQWKSVVSKKEMQVLKHGRIGNDEIEIVPMPLTITKTWFTEESGLHHRFPGRVYLISESAQTSIVTFIIDNLRLSEGKWYYCVRLLEGTQAQIGWATTGFTPTDTVGVGNDLYSWSYDGSQNNLYHREQYPYLIENVHWGMNDVCGCGIDISGDQIGISYWLNGHFLGTAFEHRSPIGTSTTACNMLPNGYGATYFAGVTLRATEYAMNSCEFIFHPEDMSECPLPRGYKPLLLPSLASIDQALVPYPAHAYLIGNDARDYIQTRRDWKSQKFLRDFVSGIHLENSFRFENQQLILSTETDGFPLKIDHQGSLTVSFDFEMLAKTDRADVILLTFVKSEDLAVRIPTEKIVQTNRIAITINASTRQITVYFNNDYRILIHASLPEYHLCLLPHLAVGIKNLGIWKYSLSQEHIRRLFTYGLEYVSLDYHRLQNHRERANTWIFEKNQTCFANHLLLPLNQPFDEQHYEKVKEHVDHDESKCFQSIEESERSAVQLFGNQTYLVVGKSAEPYSEYTLVLDISIARLPKADEQITLVAADGSHSAVLINDRGRITLSTGAQSESPLKLNEYIRLVISVATSSLRIYANGLLMIDTVTAANQWMLNSTRIDLFREVDLVKNSTDEHTVRIACQSITYWNKATTTIDDKLKSSVYLLDSFLTPSYEVVAPSLLLIGYDQALIESILKRNPTATFQSMDTLLREKRRTTEDILLKLQHAITLPPVNRTQSLDNLTELVFRCRKFPSSEFSPLTADTVSLDKKWFAQAVHHLDINESLIDWIRDKSTHANEFDTTYQLLDFNQPQQDTSAPLGHRHKLAHYSHRQLTSSQYRQSRIACEQELIAIYAHYTILNMLRIWSADAANPFPLEVFGDYTFIITLLKLLDYHYTYTRLHLDENIDRMSLLTTSILKMEINELTRHHIGGENPFPDEIFQQRAPLLFQLEKDVVRQWVRYLSNPSEKIFDDDEEETNTISKHVTLNQPNFRFLLKLFHLFLQLVTDRVIDDLDFLISLLFPPLYINLLFDLFLLSQSYRSKTSVLHIFSTLMQTSKQFTLNQTIQSFLFHLFVELPPNPTSIKSRTMKTFQIGLMDLVYLLVQRSSEEPSPAFDVTQLPPDFHKLLTTIDLVHALTDKTGPVKINLHGDDRWKLSAEEIEKCQSYFDSPVDQQLMRFLNNHPLIESDVVELISTLPNELDPNPIYYKIYPSLSHIPAIHIQTRAKLIHQFNLSLDDALCIIDLNLLAGQSLLVDTVRLARSYILHPIKFESFMSSLLATEVETTDGVPTVNFDIVAASSSQKTDVYTMFNQAYEQLHRDAHVTFRSPNDRLWLAQYIGMHSTDQGGPYRDSITRLCADICSTRLPLFILCPNGRMNNGLNRDRWIPNVFPPNRSIPHRIKKQYRFIGQLMGMAVRKKHYLDLKLPELLWKQLVCEPTTLEDIESIDVQSFTMVKEMEKTIEQVQSIGNIDEIFTSMMDDLRFEGVSSAGQTYELVPGGKELPITAYNFKDYCQAYREYRLNEFRRQIEFVRQGLYNIVPGYFLSLFTANELEQAVCGKGEIDVELLKRNTCYGGDYSADTPYMQQFWTVLTEMLNEEQKRLFLIFVWGRCTLPSRDEDFIYKFTINPYDLPSNEVNGALPRSHTCTFAIDLPQYSSADIMYERLNYAITYCSSIDGDGMMNDMPAPTEFDSDLSASEQ